MNNEEINKIINDTLDRIRPTESEKKLLLSIFEKIKKAIIDCSGNFPVANVVEGGSVAKDTFLRGDADLDIFVQIKTETKELLEKFVLNTIDCISKQLNCEYKIAYAENPYAHIFLSNYENIEADLVPIAYAKNYEELVKALKISGMARTPFHTEFAKKHLTPELRDQVRLLKYFFKQKKIYGIFGFTGWLCELLIIHYKSFLNVIKNANKIVNLELDLLGRFSPRQLRKKFPHDRIIILDPTDPNRNAAAGIQGFMGEVYLKRFLKSAEIGLKKPKELFSEVKPKGNIRISFTLREKDALKENVITSIGRVANHLNKNLVKVGYSIEDAFIIHNPPQLILKIEPETKAYDYVIGPPKHLSHAVKKFLEKHKEHEVILQGNRYVAKVPSKYPNAISAVQEVLAKIKVPLLKGYKIAPF